MEQFQRGAEERCGRHAGGFLASLFGMALHAQAETITVRTVGVSDGDTIAALEIDNTQHKIRLAGIIAPEKSQPFGQRFKESLSAFVFGSIVTVETDKVDRYRRKVVKVMPPEGMDANLEQVRRNLAWHYKDYQQEQSEADRATYAAAENVARGQHQLLWMDAQPVVPWKFRKWLRISDTK